MTTNELIYEVYEGLNINSDDTNIDERLILHKIASKRALWVSNEMNKRFRNIPPALIQDLGCLELEETSSEECCSSQLDCYFMRTVLELPMPISLHRDLLITRVGSKDKKEKEYTLVSYERIPFVGNGRFNQNGIYAFWLNNRIYLMSKNQSIILFEGINIMGVFEAPHEAVNLITCDGLPSWTYDSKYPLYGKLWEYIRPQVEQDLMKKMLIPQDNVNDGTTKENKGQAQPQ
tara:strand:- start:6920 stop:7618 length:699 start_codon:yes stop_codon:yes gene_type:complete